MIEYEWKNCQVLSLLKNIKLYKRLILGTEYKVS